MTHIYKTTIKTIATLFVLFFATLTFAQSNSAYNARGEKQGVVRIKVNKATASILKQSHFKTKRGVITTGVSAIDAVSSQSQASQVSRLFPENPNPKLEAKLRKHGLDLWYEIQINPNQDVAQVAKQYQSLGEVSIAETERLKIVSNYTPIEKLGAINTFMTAPFNDPYLSEQWHYNNTGQTGFAGGADVNLYKAWETTAGSSNVIVSVHDEGVDTEHEDLMDNIWINEAELNGTDGVDDDGNGFIDDVYGWNFVKNSNVMDADVHGTHVAGTVAAVNNNGIGVAGVAGGTGNYDGAKIMSLKIIGGQGAAANSFVYAADNGAVISQNSWGYTVPGNTEQAVRDAINYFIAEAGDYDGSPMKGGIVIFAAGNANSDSQWYPGYYPEVFTVSALGPEGKKASYSNFGTWVDIAAPGGDIAMYGNENGVLSTLPNNKIGYLDGTSMACPHISGIAALALANATKQITPEELQQKLLTGTSNIDVLNPDYIGKLGQLSDAYLAIQNNQEIAPEAVSDLTVDGLAQEFATLSWTVPSDKDDNTPYNFTVYYSDKEITNENYASADKVETVNNSNAGEKITYTLENLYGLTTYHFAISATDRWGNVSLLSNIVSGTTNAGPQINVDENSKAITLNIDALTSVTGTHDINILNEAEGTLRWDYEARHTSTALSYSRTAAYQPKGKTKTPANATIGKQDLPTAKSGANAIPSPMRFEPNSLQYYLYETNIIGEEDTEIPNSSATKFVVSNEDGFNLTDVKSYLKFDPELGPVTVEIYKGEQLNRDNLMLSQEYTYYANEQHYAYIKLNEQLYFEQGETFWIVFHVPAGNLYPLGLGPKADLTDTSHNNCFMSFDGGATWGNLADLIESEDYVWVVAATSNNEFLGEYLTLNPDSGEILGNENAQTTLTANAANLINGTYTANVILKSNDGKQPELRLPITLNVENQQPVLSAVSELDFGSVFQGKSKELTFTLTNTGLGNFTNISITSTSPQFELVGYAPWQIAAKQFVDVTIKYTPGQQTGNDNGVLKISSASNSESANIILFGVSTEPGKIVVTPQEQTIDNLTIGDAVTANISVKNEGASALRYFIPNFDTQGIGNDWEEDYSAAGYKFRSNHNGESSPIAFAYEDISATGENITQYFKDNGNVYKSVDMGFRFPYYKQQLSTLYIAKGGFTTFDDSLNPVNNPDLDGAPWTPKGYISPIGTWVDLTIGGTIYYQVKPDRVIVQYDNIPDGIGGSISAQMVLFKDGNIRFYYNNVTFAENNLGYLNILIEDFDQEEGILYNNYDNQNPVYTGMAIGYDYPGPDIITGITNGSGILLPGDQAELSISLATDDLNEGITNRYINIISNDPSAPQTIALVQLNITDGGTPNVSISETEIDFGAVFQGLKTSRTFILNNEGTADASITAFTQSTNNFIVTGETSGTVAAASSLVFDVEMPTDVVGDFNDFISITTDEGSSFEINIKGSVLDPPAIDVDLTPLTETLNYGETASHELNISNPGKADLEFVATGNAWLSLGNKLETSNGLANYSYSVDMYNTGENYNWLDIRSTGTQLPHIQNDFYNPDEFYRALTLTNPIQFYGEDYTTIYIAENGAIFLEKPTETIINGDTFPSEYADKIIAPYWTFGGFNTYLFDAAEVGVFYTEDDSKTVISWEYLLDNFGGIGAPMSAQVIFYKNGTMKFQYKLNGNFDFSSNYTVIGLQDKTKDDSVLLSQRSTLAHGSGLAYILSPAEKHIVAPGETLSTFVNIDAGSVYAGTYTDAIKLRTNVPNFENLEKPVTLTVNGDAKITPSTEVIDYGSIMAYTTSEGPKSYIREFDIHNTGVAVLDLSGITLAENSENYTVELYVYDDWFGSWYWSNVDFLWNWPSLQPGNSAKFRITYTPQNAGDITNELIVSSSLPEALHIPVTATVTLPPVFGTDTSEIYSSIATPTGTDTQTATFNNAEGSGDLTFGLSLDYLREALETSSTSENQTLGSFANHKNLALQLAASNLNASTTETSRDYNRTLAHDSKTTPDTFIGFGGATDFISSTRFNAGAEGFTLSHIQTFIKADELLEGTIEYEIRAGGTTIADATILGSGNFNYNITEGTESEITIALNQSYAMYPNEEFYIILKFPFDLAYPQSVVTGLDTVPGRFTTLDNNQWLDLQEIYPDYGWMVRALEETYTTNAWVTVEDVIDPNIAVGASKNVTLDFFAANAKAGDQHAKLVVKTNDPFKPVAQIPVTLHVNQAPGIADIPELIVINEGETTTHSFTIVDTENDELSVNLQNAPSWINHTLDNNTLTFTMTPDHESEGVYIVNVLVSDVNGASTTETVTIEVMDANRAPEALDFTELNYETINMYDNLSFTDFFVDPDGDEMTFNVSVTDASIVNAFTSGANFILQTLLEGSTTLKLTATDSFGASTEIEVTVNVGQSLGIDHENTLGLQLYPNPASSVLNIAAQVSISTIEIYSINGQLVLRQELENTNRKTSINVSKLEDGVYFIKAYATQGTSNFKFVKQ